MQTSDEVKVSKGFSRLAVRSSSPGEATTRGKEGREAAKTGAV